MWLVAVVLDNVVIKPREEESGQMGSNLCRSHLLGIDDEPTGMFSHFPQLIKKKKWCRKRIHLSRLWEDGDHSVKAP